MKKKNPGPDYKKIFKDLIRIKFPEKERFCTKILDKQELSILDVLELNTIIFGHKAENQRFKSYDERAIKEILNHQKTHQLSNTELANAFRLSRNTVTKWRKIFPG